MTITTIIIRRNPGQGKEGAIKTARQVTLHNGSAKCDSLWQRSWVNNGFGISDGAQAREAARHANAVVVGSALVEAARKGRLAMLVRELATAVHGV